jgi:hypothetical protein
MLDKDIFGKAILSAEQAARWLTIPKQPPLTAGDVQPARDYIAGYWQKLTRFHPDDDESLLGVPQAIPCT